MHVSAVSILDQGCNCDRKSVRFWIIWKVEPIGFSGGLDIGHTETMESSCLKFGPK